MDGDDDITTCLAPNFLRSPSAIYYSVNETSVKVGSNFVSLTDINVKRVARQPAGRILGGVISNCGTFLSGFITDHVQTKVKLTLGQVTKFRNGVQV